DQPALVDAIAVEAAAEVIVQPAAGHAVERLADHRQGVFVTEAVPTAEQEPQVDRVRELRGGAEPAVPLVERPAQQLRSDAEQTFGQLTLDLGGFTPAAQRVGDAAGRAGDLVAAI